MQLQTSRRHFLKAATVAATSLGTFLPQARSVTPFQRTGQPRLLLSLAAYSFRDYFANASHEQAPAAERKRTLDLFQFLDFCAEHGCHGAELTSYYFPKTTDDELLLRLRRHAFLKGLSISGTAVGNTFTRPEGPQRQSEIALVKTWIHHAQVMGASHVRVFAGGTSSGVNLAEAKRLCIAALEECAVEAAKAGVFVGLENHGGIVAQSADLLDILRQINSPWVGINLDTGNFHTPDPYADVAACAPYAVNVQLKAEITPQGQSVQPADLPRLIRILRDVHYQGYVALEYESAADPWTAVPKLLQQLKPLLA